MNLEDFLTNLFVVAMVGLMAAAALYLIGTALYFLYRLIFFDFSYGELKSEQGTVLDMKYTPPRTIHSRHATTRSPEKNEVLFRTKTKETQVDSDKLYQRVRVGEEITVKFQERYKRPRFWHGYWTLDGYRLVSVTSKLDQTVDFNEKKPVLGDRYDTQRTRSR